MYCFAEQESSITVSSGTSRVNFGCKKLFGDFSVSGLIHLSLLGSRANRRRHSRLRRFWAVLDARRSRRSMATALCSYCRSRKADDCLLVRFAAPVSFSLCTGVEPFADRADLLVVNRHWFCRIKQACRRSFFDFPKPGPLCIKSAVRKLKAHNRSQAVAKAMGRGLIC